MATLATWATKIDRMRDAYASKKDADADFRRALDAKFGATP